MEEPPTLLVEPFQPLAQSESENDIDILNEVDILRGFNDQSLDKSSVPKQSPKTTLSKPVKHLRLPFSKIKHIMKMDPDILLVQQDAIFLVSKATELFIEYLAKETHKQLAGNKRKTLMKRDLDVTIESIPQLCFLDGALE